MKYIPIIIICIIILVLLGIFLYLQNNIIDITSYIIKSDFAKNSYRIVQLSDLHSRPFKKVLSKTKEQNPDIICITGDYINDHQKNKDKMIEYGKELLKIAPVYYITGNHERRLEGFDEIINELNSIGFKVLLNEYDVISNHKIDIAILGLDENQASFDAYKERRKGTFQYKDMSQFFSKFEKESSFKLVLSHFPENFMGIKEMNYSQYDFDLQLSGHAHGGQFILPFIGPVFSPGQGVFPKYARGSFGNRPRLIVSRGLGNAEFPFRLFNHPEINVINIESK